MPRISYGANTFGGKILAEQVDQIAKAQAEVSRIKAIADQITSGGTNKAALEGCTEFDVGTGDGADFYDALVTLKANLLGVTEAALAQLDMGG